MDYKRIIKTTLIIVFVPTVVLAGWMGYKKFILKLPQDGFLVSNKDDKNLFKISKGALFVAPFVMDRQFEQRSSAEIRFDR